jgi:hypothetical protein
MERKEILEKKLALLEELEKLEKEEAKTGTRDENNRYDLRALTDPRELGGLRKLTDPREFTGLRLGFPGPTGFPIPSRRSK